jgi:hypothetical protein
MLSTYTGKRAIHVEQGWANSGPLRVFLWSTKTVRKIRLEQRFPSRARPKIRLVFSTRTATSIRMCSVDTMRSAFLVDLVNFNFVFATVNI